MAKNSDLHTHTYYSSDSDISPTNLVIEAKKIGLEHIAITDHDSIQGIQEALTAGIKHNIDVIPGIELHSKFGEVLGYFIDFKNPKIIKLCRKNKKAINERALKTITLLNENGYELSSSLMKKKYKVEILERPIIAKELISKGYISSFREAFDKFLSKGNKYYIEADYSSTEDIIKIITNSGGLAVLAHPYFEDYTSEFENLSTLIKAGLIGIECANLKEFRPQNYNKVVKEIKQLAKKYDLILTSGSDYHGTIHPYNKLGDFNCDEKVVVKLRKLIE